jgi:hypothetical protein
VAEAAAAIQPAMAELIRQAAQGEVLHNDDTSMPVLALRRNTLQTDVGSPGSRPGWFHACVGSSTARGPGVPCEGVAPGVAFRLFRERQHPEGLAAYAARSCHPAPTLGNNAEPLERIRITDNSAPRPAIPKSSGKCRDGAAKSCNCLKSNGVGGHSLVEKAS